jgi:broad specificity phosphatase PhoE
LDDLIAADRHYLASSHSVSATFPRESAPTDEKGLPMRLLLIRHAETSSNCAGLLDTRIPGPGLTRRGQEQAQRLVSTLADERIEAVYASTQLLTALTAMPVASELALPLVIRDGLREIPAGSLEMCGDDSSIQIYLASLASWVAGQLSVRVPDGENGHQFLARRDAVVDEIANSGCQVAAAFSHGGSIRTWTSIRARNVNPSVDLNYDLDNTAVITLEDSPGEWFLKTQPSDRRLVLGT